MVGAGGVVGDRGGGGIRSDRPAVAGLPHGQDGLMAGVAERTAHGEAFGEPHELFVVKTRIGVPQRLLGACGLGNARMSVFDGGDVVDHIDVALPVGIDPVVFPVG